MYSVLVCIALLLAACSLRRPPRFVTGSAAEKSIRDYVDLRPGWRVRVVTPILKSGGYKPQIKETVNEGRAITLMTDDDFVGHEASYYAVKGKDGGGVKIVFISAWVTEQGKTTRRPHPLVRLFEFPDSARFVRLIYTLRVSQTDHDAAIVAASNQQELEDLTKRVLTDPAEACRIGPADMCRWVPTGIAVQTEEGHQEK